MLAESPGADEEDFGRPLIGKSGSFLFDGDPGIGKHIWPGLARLGLGRDTVRCENVVEVKPINNDLDTIDIASMGKWREDLARRLSALPQVELIIPMGNCALNALLASPLKQKKKRGGGREWKWAAGISAWRGSVNEVRVGERAVTMIPTFHPAYFLWGGAANFQAWRSDWERIRDAAEIGVEPWPKLTHIVAPTRAQCELFAKLVQHTWHREAKDALLAFDIETIGPLIDCIGFCVDGETTLTIPLLPQLWPGGAADVRWAWQWVRGLLEHEIPKGTHFGYYDVYRLERQKGLRVKKWWWDSFDLHHLIDPADEHSLAYCASRDLRFGFWKNESTADKRGGKKSGERDWIRRSRYNGKDVGVTWNLIRIYQKRLRAPWEPTWQMLA